MIYFIQNKDFKGVDIIKYDKTKLHSETSIEALNAKTKTSLEQSSLLTFVTIIPEPSPHECGPNK